MHPEPKRTISHYEIIERIGEGGMGEVYKARDIHLERFVAIKILRSKTGAGDERQARFIKEAKSASSLNHANIITIYEIGNDGDETFIAMEYIEGTTLADLIKGRPLGVAQVIKNGIQIADALAAAHAAGIVHRDLKPANIMLRKDGVAKVLDFGLAKLMERVQLAPTETLETAAPATARGVILGTVAYMSPEQAEGKPVDGRSDIFSFGVVLYEMVTGRRPFSGDSSLSTLSAILARDPEPLSTSVKDVPEELQRIVTRCLRKDPERRFQTMADVRIALTDLKEESESGQRLTVALAAAHPRRFPWWYAVAAAALVVVALGIYLLVRSGGAKPQDLRIRPLTSYVGTEYRASFSPEGTQFAFAWNGPSRDNIDIYVKVLDEADALRITTSPEMDENPAWSPDGRRIAYFHVANKVRSLFLTTPVGGQARRIGDFQGRLAAWLADSRHLIVADRTAPATPLKLFSIGIEANDRQPLTSPPADSSGDDEPAVSPDGHSIAFVRKWGNTRAEIRALKFDESLSTQGEHLVAKESRRLNGITWSADGRDLIFSAAGKLWRVAASGSTAPQALDFIPDQAFNPVIFSGSRTVPPSLVYERYIDNAKVWQSPLPAASAERAPVEGDAVAPSTHREEFPQYSPDEQQIAFESDRSGNFEVWVCNVDGTHPVQHTSFNTTPAGCPRWSPDGRRLAFNGGQPTGVYVVDLDGGAPRRLTPPDWYAVRPSWSSDGKFVYFSSAKSGRYEIWKTSADGGTPVPVTTEGGFEPFESPDGQYLYYVKSLRDGELWRVPVSGGNQEVVEAAVKQGMWALSGQGVFFAAKDSAGRFKYTVKFLPYGTQNARDVGTIAGTLSVFTVSRSGQRMAWEIEDSQADLMIVDNFH